MRYVRFVLLGLLAVAALVVGPVPVAHAATFTVDSTGDATDFSTADGVCDTDDSTGDGPCTLRAAIEQANATGGTDMIAFDIPAAGPHTISPGSPLPTITDPVIIDGYSQPGASPNTNPPELGSNAVLKIELDGTVGGGWGLNITAGNSTISGLVINSFGGGIMLYGSGGNTIDGNFIGTDKEGTADQGNSGNGVRILNSSNNTIGGTAAAARNVISGNDHFGLSIMDAPGNVIQGNYIGTDVTGTGDLGNTYNGVVISDAPNNTVGGRDPGARNVISGNETYGVVIGGSDATGIQVQGNFIGTQADGTSPLGNGFNGVKIFSASDNTIGGTASGEGNIIAFTPFGAGVLVDGLGSVTMGNTIRGNSIHSNAGKGIWNKDGGNAELPPPVVSSAGSASGTACANCVVDLYSDDADEGRIYHGSTIADGSGNWSFPGAVVGPNVTATATDVIVNTSEFSTPFVATTCPAMPWPTPVGDNDCDGFTTADENLIGTDPLLACGAGAWPPDTYEDQLVDSQDMVALLPGLFKSVGQPGYDARLDIFQPGTIIDSQDLVVFLPFLFKSCTPP